MNGKFSFMSVIYLHGNIFVNRNAFKSRITVISKQLRLCMKSGSSVITTNKYYLKNLYKVNKHELDY